MTKQKLSRELRALDIDVQSMSFYTGLDEYGDVVDMPDSEYGVCDLSGLPGVVSNCVARSIDGARLIHFVALDELVGGHLGKLAGAF